MRSAVKRCLAVMAMAVAGTAWGQVTGTPGAPGPAPVAAPASAPSADLLASRKYAEALAAAELILQKEPGNLDQAAVKIQALLGLGRTMEALRFAVPLSGQHPERPQFRFLAGQAAFQEGMVPQAVQVWSALRSNPDPAWSLLGYRASAQALLAVGKVAEARNLVAEAMAKGAAPSLPLARLALETAPDAASALGTIDRVIASSPENKDDWSALKTIMASVQGGLFAESPAGAAPLVIPIKEKSERINIPAWGTEDQYASAVTLSSGSRVTVPVTAGGKKQWMLLDSGSDVVLLTSAFARDLGLKPVATAEYLGLGYKGAMKSGWVVVPALTVGELEFKNVPAMIIDKDTDFWKELGGILPLSMFRRHAILYDRRHEKLTLYPAGTKPESVLGGTFFSLKSLWFNGQPFVLAQIKGRPNLPCLVDTGASSTYLAAEFAQTLGVKVNSGKYANQYSQGMSGGFSSGTAEQVEIQLGAARFQLPTVLVTSLGQNDAMPCYGIVGRDILDNFQVFFDYPGNALAIKAYDR